MSIGPGHTFSLRALEKYRVHNESVLPPVPDVSEGFANGCLRVYLLDGTVLKCKITKLSTVKSILFTVKKTLELQNDHLFSLFTFSEEGSNVQEDLAANEKDKNVLAVDLLEVYAGRDVLFVYMKKIYLPWSPFMMDDVMTANHLGSLHLVYAEIMYRVMAKIYPVDYIPYGKRHRILVLAMIVETGDEFFNKRTDDSSMKEKLALDHSIQRFSARWPLLAHLAVSLNDTNRNHFSWTEEAKHRYEAKMIENVWDTWVDVLAKLKDSVDTDSVQPRGLCARAKFHLTLLCRTQLFEDMFLDMWFSNILVTISKDSLGDEVDKAPALITVGHTGIKIMFKQATAKDVMYVDMEEIKAWKKTEHDDVEVDVYQDSQKRYRLSHRDPSKRPQFADFLSNVIKTYVFEVVANSEGKSMEAKGVEWTETEIRKIFVRLDTNKDNVLDCNELTSLLISMGHPSSKPEVETVFEDMDLDENGVVTFEEFCAWWERVHRHGPGPKMDTTDNELHAEARVVFGRLDSTKSNKIDGKDLEDFVKDLGVGADSNAAVEGLQTLIAQTNGKIDYDVFFGYYKTHNKVFKNWKENLGQENVFSLDDMLQSVDFSGGGDSLVQKVLESIGEKEYSRGEASSKAHSPVQQKTVDVTPDSPSEFKTKSPAEKMGKKVEDIVPIVTPKALSNEIDHNEAVESREVYQLKIFLQRELSHLHDKIDSVSSPVSSDVSQPITEGTNVGNALTNETVSTISVALKSTNDRLNQEIHGIKSELKLIQLKNEKMFSDKLLEERKHHEETLLVASNVLKDERKEFSQKRTQDLAHLQTREEELDRLRAENKMLHADIATAQESYISNLADITAQHQDTLGEKEVIGRELNVRLLQQQEERIQKLSLENQRMSEKLTSVREDYIVKLSSMTENLESETRKHGGALQKSSKEKHDLVMGFEKITIQCQRQIKVLEEEIEKLESQNLSWQRKCEEAQQFETRSKTLSQVILEKEELLEIANDKLKATEVTVKQLQAGREHATAALKAKDDNFLEMKTALESKLEESYTQVLTLKETILESEKKVSALLEEKTEFKVAAEVMKVRAENHVKEQKKFADKEEQLNKKLEKSENDTETTKKSVKELRTSISSLKRDITVFKTKLETSEVTRRQLQELVANHKGHEKIQKQTETKLNEDVQHLKRKNLILKQNAHLVQQQKNDEAQRHRIIADNLQRDSQSALLKLRKSLIENRQLSHHISVLEAKLKTSTEDHQTLEAKHIKLVAENKMEQVHLQSEITRLKGKCVELINKITLQQEQDESNKSKHQGLENKIAGLTSSMEALNSKNGKLEEEVVDMLASVTFVGKRNVELLEKLDTTAELNKKKTDELSALHSRVKELEEKVQKEQTEFLKKSSALEGTIGELQTFLTDAKRGNEELSQSLHASEKQYSDTDVLRENLANQLHDTKLQLEESLRLNQEYESSIGDVHETLGLYEHAHQLNRQALTVHAVSHHQHAALTRSSLEDDLFR